MKRTKSRLLNSLRVLLTQVMMEFQAFEKLLWLPAVVFQPFETDRKDKKTQNEFQYQAQKVSHIAHRWMEADLLFKLCERSNERMQMAYNDSPSIASHEQQISLWPVLLRHRDKTRPIKKKIIELKSTGEDENKDEQRSYSMSVLKSLYRLSFGFMAGATGVAAVYPIDLVKTRMQNQRINPQIDERIYHDSIDCFFKVFKNEGIRGLYRGIIPQICGIAPEKAAKLTVNDLVRDHLKHQSGYLPLWAEFLAGACGGASQVVFSCPVEIIKIRLQTAGEVQGGPRPTAISIIKELFFYGLYKGVGPCLCRDIIFAGIYFPTYSNVKKLFADETGHNEPHTLLTSGVIAGVLAASLSTPFDVVKTRLQVKPRKGQTTYKGIADTFRKLWREEGWTAFWKGTGVRVCMSSPQLGVTLVTYELLQRYFYFDFDGWRPEGSEYKYFPPKKLSYNLDEEDRYDAAIPMITGIETQFGISLPKYNIVPIPISQRETNEP
nr:calcium-binding mitochondrial carrier protein Aralar1 isoform X2 [Halyomorpha halys]